MKITDEVEMEEEIMEEDTKRTEQVKEEKKLKGTEKVKSKAVLFEEDYINHNYDPNTMVLIEEGEFIMGSDTPYFIQDGEGLIVFVFLFFCFFVFFCFLFFCIIPFA